MRNLIMLSILIFILTGCATPAIKMKVESLSADDSKKKYVLMPGNKGVSDTNLQYKEFSTYIHRALGRHGFIKADDFDKAEMVILVMYGISKPSTTITTMPVYGQTGISESTKYGTVTTEGDSKYYTGTTRYTPTYGITGYIPAAMTE